LAINLKISNVIVLKINFKRKKLKEYKNLLSINTVSVQQKPYKEAALLKKKTKQPILKKSFHRQSSRRIEHDRVLVRKENLEKNYFIVYFY